MAYRIALTHPALEQLEWIDKKHHRALRDAIREALEHQPLTPTRNRKALDPAILGATWELRCGPANRYRVLYEVSVETEDEPGAVTILAIGEKRGAQLFIAGTPVLEEEA